MPHEAISAFDIFKIGIGPSSSHTLGPWRAAQRFVEETKPFGLDALTHLEVLLYGSLAKTGVGHGTDVAILMGLSGADPVTFPVAELEGSIQRIRDNHSLLLGGIQYIPFNPASQLRFLASESLPYHPNAVSFLASFMDGRQISQTYYSIGGGFVVKEGEDPATKAVVAIPFPVNTAENLLHWCRKTGLSIWEVVLENESAWRTEAETRAGLLEIWKVMRHCAYLGCHSTGVLPGGLGVKRRAGELNKRLLKGKIYTNEDEWIAAIRAGGSGFQYTLDWVSAFALAVNEENASFRRVVTAPTNGAAGVIPAVLLYHLVFGKAVGEDKIVSFLLTAAEIGSIFKKGATISAAMGGCQAEIGVSSSMAAAALTEAMGGTQRQALQAAEIAMEHHLGMTCDPIGGLVQVPCIERNTMGAIKAITAAQLAMQSQPDFAKVSLDVVVETMWETALDMNSKYKETSEGGLAVNLPINLSEC